MSRGLPGVVKSSSRSSTLVHNPVTRDRTEYTVTLAAGDRTWTVSPESLESFHAYPLGAKYNVEYTFGGKRKVLGVAR